MALTGNTTLPFNVGALDISAVAEDSPSLLEVEATTMSLVLRIDDVDGVRWCWLNDASQHDDDDDDDDDGDDVVMARDDGDGADGRTKPEACRHAFLHTSCSIFTRTDLLTYITQGFARNLILVPTLYFLQMAGEH